MPRPNQTRAVPPMLAAGVGTVFGRTGGGRGPGAAGGGTAAYDAVYDAFDSETQARRRP